MRRRLAHLLVAAAVAAGLHGRPGLGLHGLCLQREGQHGHASSIPTTMQVVKTIDVGQRPRGITISHDGKFIYLCASDDDTIEIIDTATLRDRRHAAVRPRSRNSSCSRRTARRSTSPTRTTISSP